MPIAVDQDQGQELAAAYPAGTSSFDFVAAAVAAGKHQAAAASSFRLSSCHRSFFKTYQVGVYPMSFKNVLAQPGRPASDTLLQP